MFRRWLDTKRSISCEDGLQQGTGSRYMTEHTANVLAILRKHMLHHEFNDGAATMETIAMAADIMLEITRKAGTEVLLHDGESYVECLQFFKHFFAKYNLMREEILLEMCLFIASNGQLHEAYDVVESYLSVEPYKSNPLYHGYCGLLQYLLYRHEKDTGSGVANVHTKKALSHFEVLQNRQFSGSMNIEAFVRRHADLLFELDRGQEARELLISFRDKFPQDINPNRYVCDYLREHDCEDDRDLRISSLWKLVAVDESCPETVELADLLMEDDSPDYGACAKLILHYLDYPCNGEDVAAWELLKKLHRVQPELISSPEWTVRVKWWAKMYPKQFTAAGTFLA